MPDAKKYAIHEAVREDEFLTVRNFLEENPKLSVLKDEDLRTPLHWACTMNNMDMIDLILPYVKVNLDNLADDSGWTPVHIIAALGNQKILAKFMARDPEPNIDLHTNTGATCLHLAVSKNHCHLVADLTKLYKCSVRTKDKKGYTALHRAASIGSQPLIKMLLEAQANVNATDSDGWTPLHHALAEGHGDIGVLLVSLGAHVSIESSAGEVPAQVASGDSVKRFFESAIQ